MATVLDLKSGVPWLVIDTGMQIWGLGVAGDTIAVVGDRRIITWNLPAGDHVLNARVNINDSVQATTLDHSALFDLMHIPFTSISPDLNCIAIAHKNIGLNIYDMSIGICFTDAVFRGGMVWFTPDGHKVWCYSPIYRWWG
jgi:hypothetical protein